METVKIDTFRLKGLPLGQKTTTRGGQASMDCRRLWEIFNAEFYFNKIIDKISNEIYAVYYDYEGEKGERFSYFIGCKVPYESAMTEGMKTIEIPSGTYMYNPVKGKLPESIANTWKQINQTAQGRAYEFDFEVYTDKSMDWEDAEIDVFISVIS
jgi:predicted transcriptional regulator YdeE